jgi:hypothetical protein
LGKEKVFCAKQIPANITGDGNSSIEKLIEEKIKIPKEMFKPKLNLYSIK